MSDFLESDGYIRRKAEGSISSKDLYAIYRMWCDENGLQPLKPRTFTDGVIAVAGRYNLEHCNNVTNAAGRRARGFLGIEAVTRAGYNDCANFDSVRTYVHDGWD